MIGAATATKVHPRRARALAVASGKGGVGKTSLAVNLSVALARLERQTMLIDCDFGMANAAIMLGLNEAVDLDAFAAGTRDMASIMIDGPHGLKLVPGGNAGNLPPARQMLRRRIARDMRDRAESYDYVVVDTPSGASPQTIATILDSDRVLLVISSEPTTFMDAYVTLKLLAAEQGTRAVSVVANMVEDQAEGLELFQRFSEVATRFLPSDLDFLGSVPRDESMRRAVFHKRCCVEAFPESRAAVAIQRLARAIDRRSIEPTSGGDRLFSTGTMAHAL